MVDRLGRRIVRLMAGHTRRTQTCEGPASRAMVAGFAIRRRVRAHQRETIRMLADCLHSDFPAADGVAIFAIGSQLTPVNIRMT